MDMIALSHKLMPFSPKNDQTYNHYHTLLYQLLFQNTGLQQIIETGSEIIGTPLLLQDMSGRFICCSSQLNAKNLSLTSVEDTAGPAEIITAYKKPIAILSMIGPAKEFSPYDTALLQLVAKITALEMQKKNYQYYFKQHAYEYILHDLIEGRIDDTQPIARMLAESGMPLRDSLYLLTLTSANQQKFNTMLRELMNQLKTLSPSSEFIIYNDNLLMIIQKNAGEILDTTEIDGVRGFLRENSLYGGLSFQFNDITSLKKYYLQTLRAIAMGQHLKKDGPLYFFEDYSFYHMLDICKQDSDLAHFTAPSLLALLRYDKNNKTDLTHTFYQYIKQNGNHKAIADALYIHHSTLTYRMNKIRKILRTELNQDFLFQAEFSFKILEYLNQLPFLP